MTVGEANSNGGIGLETEENASSSRISQTGSYPLADYRSMKGETFPVYCVSVESFLDVYLQLNGEETNKVLDLTSDYVQSLPKGEKLRPFLKAVGTPCLAFFEEDDFWYRARFVGDLGNGIYEVYFVDYGNKMKLKEDQIMACPEFLVNYVEGVTKVALNGFTGDETKREVEILRDLMVYKDFMARIDCVNFEIKGKNRMLLSLFDVGDGTATPLKAKVEQALKAQRDADRAPLKEKEFNEEISAEVIRSVGNSSKEDAADFRQCAPSDDLLKVPTPNVESNEVPKEEEDGIKSETKQMQLSADGIKQADEPTICPTLLSTILPDRKSERSVEGSMEDVRCTAAELQGAEVIPKMDSLVVHYDEGEARPVSVAEHVDTQSVVEDASGGNEPASNGGEQSPIVSVTLKMSSVPGEPQQENTLTPATVFRQLVEDSLDGPAVPHSPPPLSSPTPASEGLNTKEAHLPRKSESDWILEKMALENRWRSMESELKAQMKKQKEDHEKAINDWNAKLHSAYMSKSCAQGKVSELENKLACETKKSHELGVMMEKLQIENDRLVHQNIEFGKVQKELCLKIAQVEEMTSRYKRALSEQEVAHNDAVNVLRNSHEAEQDKLRQEIFKFSHKIREQEQAITGLTSEISDMNKVNLELRVREGGLAEDAEQAKSELQGLRKENGDLKIQVQQLLKMKEDFEKQQIEKVVPETVYERRASVSSTEIMSPASVRASVAIESNDLEALMVKQKRVIRQLGETIDALTKINIEEAEVMVARMKAKDAKVAELMNMQKD